MAKVKKALIPAAGLGTRFLPATKTVPKEMLPIVDAPIILYIVEECVRAGIEDIVLISGRGKEAIERFFDRSYELEAELEKSGKTELLERITRVRDMANVISIRQKKALGLGHAVYCGHPVIGNEPFAVLLGDELMIADDKTPTATEELVNTYHDKNESVVGIMEVPEADVSKYGIVDVDDLGSGLFKIKNVIEKPSVDEAPSRYSLPGRYVFSANMFKYLKETKPGRNGEIQLTDAMVALAQNEGMLAMVNKAKRYDAGDKLGYLQANIELALQRPELKDSLKTYLKELAGNL